MPCTRIGGTGFDGFACSRGGRSRRRCFCGKPAVALCDYALTGRKAGDTCDAPLCGTHAHRQGRHQSGEHKGDTIDYCLVHHEMTKGQQKLEFE
jgi:hypothetical protein